MDIKLTFFQVNNFLKAKKRKKMDSLDLKILNIIQQDSTLSMKEIAAKVGLTYTPTYERIKNLEEDGVIVGRPTLLNPSKIGLVD